MAAIAAGAVVVIVAGVLLTSAPATGPGIASASGSARPTAIASGPGGSPGSTSGPGSSGSTAEPGSSAAPEGDWTALTEPAFQPLVALTADTQDAAGIATTTAFTLHAKAPLDAASLARSLQVSPATAFDVVPGADATTATVRPVGGLTVGATYRFALADASGTALGNWAFAVKQPLHVVTTLPDDRSTDVPLTTGIEITFDQDGATDVASHVTIKPALTGHSETHGRTYVFVPDKLAERTLYTVTVHAGIKVSGSDETLTHDMTFAFETGIPDDATPPAFVRSERVVLETSPHDRATVVVDVDVPDGGEAVATLPVEVHRLGSQAAALGALRQLIVAPGWARFSQQGLVDTTALPRVASFTAQLGDFGPDSFSHWFRFPTTLPAGWYIITISRPDRDLQAFLQVSDLATYAAITATRSVVWVNDTTTHAASRGATVSLAGGARLGRTDSRGIIVATTPKAVLERLTGVAPATDAPILVVKAADGRTALVPAGLADGDASHYIADITGDGGTQKDRFFHLLYTDRTLYRQTDQVNVWGLVRARDHAALPGRVVLSLSDPSSPSGPAPIVTVPVTLGPTGSFNATIPLEDVPIGPYSISLLVGPIELAGTDFTVDLIRKPTYNVTVSTDRHALLVGDPVTVAAHLAFFDGTAVPDTKVQAQGFNYDDAAKAGTTDAAGVAAIRLVATAAPDTEGFDRASLTVAPFGPEESDIFGASSVIVFPSSLWLDSKLALNGTRLTLDGSVHDVDLAGLERNAKHIAADDDVVFTLDPRGRARPGLTVDASIVELIPVKTFAGRVYDFITKQAVDTYTYSTREQSLGTRHLRSGTGGRIHLDLRVAHPDHAYRILLTVPDSKRRVARLTLEAEAAPAPLPVPDIRPRLSGVPSCSLNSSGTPFAVGQRITTTMIDGGGSLPAGGANRYLFITAQRGLRTATVQTSPRFSQSFTNATVPSLSVLGVRFTGDSYAPADQPFRAVFDPRSRALSVRLSTDAPAYRPGGLVTVTVETRDAAGRLVPATVTLRAVDQKLFAIGGAMDVDALADLYTEVSDGVLQTHASRTDVFPEYEGGCGATGGGGREDFRDSVLFRTVATGATGRATVTFNASDDLTSWHLSASAVTGALQAGSGSILIPVGLPFFVEAGLAPEYLVSDRPSVRVRAFGSGLKSGDPVTFTVSSTTLPMSATTVRGTAFQPIDIALPALHVGDQTLTITATTGSGTTARTDTLIRHFGVVATRLLTTRTGYAEVTAGLAPAHGDGATTYVFGDAGRGRFLAFLEEAAASDGARLDQALAKSLARDLIARYFPSAAADGTGAGDGAVFDPARYESETGLALLPYSGSDLELTADAALVAPGRFHDSYLRDYFHSILDDAESTRERRILALAGLAGIGDPVMSDVRSAAAATDLEPLERLYLGLAAAALGDDGTALAMETALLHAYGQRQGPWVRLNDGPTGDPVIHTTALLAMLAGEIGDPIGSAAEAYVASHPTTESVTTLIEIGYVQAAITHASAAKASFAYTVDGVRRVEDLDAGETFRLVLISSQAASLRLDPVSGTVGVTTSWEAPADLASTRIDPVVKSLTRTWSPAGVVPGSSVVTVTLTLELNEALADNECYDVTDIAPSGLAPVARLADWPPADDSAPAAPQAVDPYAIEGQRVRFCVAPLKGSMLVTMRYYLRVVTVGTYAWEPALAGSSLAPNGVGRTDPATIVVR